jgi:hypothetical protein
LIGIATATVLVAADWTSKAGLAQLKEALQAAGRVICRQPQLQFARLTIVYGKLENQRSDLMMIENFR